MRKDIERFMRERKCTACNGARLKPIVLAVTVHGYNIMDVCNLSIDDAIDFFNSLKLTDKEKNIAKKGHFCVFRENIASRRGSRSPGLLQTRLCPLLQESCR